MGLEPRLLPGGPRRRRAAVLPAAAAWRARLPPRPRPLPFLAVELDRRAPTHLTAGGRELRPSLLRPNGAEVFEVPLRRPRAVHPMWWTREDYYLYELDLRLPGARAGPVSMELRRGEDPAKMFEPELPAGPGSDGGDASGPGGSGGS